MSISMDTTSQSDDRFKSHDQFQPIEKLYKRLHGVIPDAIGRHKQKILTNGQQYYLLDFY